MGLPRHEYASTPRSVISHETEPGCLVTPDEVKKRLGLAFYNEEAVRQLVLLRSDERLYRWLVEHCIIVPTPSQPVSIADLERLNPRWFDGSQGRLSGDGSFLRNELTSTGLIVCQFNRYFQCRHFIAPETVLDINHDEINAVTLCWVLICLAGKKAGAALQRHIALTSSVSQLKTTIGVSQQLNRRITLTVLNADNPASSVPEYYREGLYRPSLVTYTTCPSK